MLASRPAFNSRSIVNMSRAHGWRWGIICLASYWQAGCKNNVVFLMDNGLFETFFLNETTSLLLPLRFSMPVREIDEIP